jgi:hypothetical protein
MRCHGRRAIGADDVLQIGLNVQTFSDLSVGSFDYGFVTDVREPSSKAVCAAPLVRSA